MSSANARPQASKFAVILAFDVPVSAEAKKVAEDFNVKIFTADIIYHLFDQFTAYMKTIKAQARQPQRCCTFLFLLSFIKNYMKTIKAQARQPQRHNGVNGFWQQRKARQRTVVVKALFTTASEFA